MKNTYLVRIFSLCLFLVLVPALVFPAGGGERTVNEEDLARVRKKVGALRAWKLAEELDLDQETSAKLFPAMKKADDDRWRIESKNRALITEMTRLMKEGRPDPGKLNGILDQLQANQLELSRIEDRHMTRVRRILPPEDFVRYLMFQLQFQREIRNKAAMAFREDRGFPREDSGPDRSDADSGNRKSGRGMGRK
jgi:hypothetical protein